MSSSAYGPELKERHGGYPADVIPLQYHAHMLLDEHRTGAFERAISEAVGAGDHVLDLGYRYRRAGVLRRPPGGPGHRRRAGRRGARGRPGGAAAPRATRRPARARRRPRLPARRPGRRGDVRDAARRPAPRAADRGDRRLQAPLPASASAARCPASSPRRPCRRCSPSSRTSRTSGSTRRYPCSRTASAAQPRTADIAAASVYQQFFYSDRLPDRCRAELASPRPARAWSTRYGCSPEPAQRAVRPARQRRLADEPPGRSARPTGTGGGGRAGGRRFRLPSGGRDIGPHRLVDGRDGRRRTTVTIVADLPLTGIEPRRRYHHRH